MRFKRCDFEFGRYEFRVVTADNLNGYCHWNSNFTNVTAVYTPSIFPILIILIYGLLITSFLFFVNRNMLKGLPCCVCVFVSFKLILWPIFMKLCMNAIAFEDVMLLISHRE
jgi:hypothetical protein